MVVQEAPAGQLPELHPVLVRRRHRPITHGRHGGPHHLQGRASSPFNSWMLHVRLTRQLCHNLHHTPPLPPPCGRASAQHPRAPAPCQHELLYKKPSHDRIHGSFHALIGLPWMHTAASGQPLSAIQRCDSCPPAQSFASMCCTDLCRELGGTHGRGACLCLAARREHGGAHARAQVPHTRAAIVRHRQQRQPILTQAPALHAVRVPCVSGFRV